MSPARAKYRPAGVVRPRGRASRGHATRRPPRRGPIGSAMPCRRVARNPIRSRGGDGKGGAGGLAALTRSRTFPAAARRFVMYRLTAWYEAGHP